MYKMFEKGEYIIYGTNGVCRVVDISTVDMQGASKDRLYYILEPFGTPGGKIFTPVDNDKILMRKVVSEEEANRLLDGILTAQVLDLCEGKQREEMYKEALRSCDCRQLLRIIKTVYRFKQDRISQGKKLNAVDEKYLKKAEENLYSELSIPLGLSREGMEEYITGRIKIAQCI